MPEAAPVTIATGCVILGCQSTFNCSAKKNLRLSTSQRLDTEPNIDVEVSYMWVDALPPCRYDADISHLASRGRHATHTLLHQSDSASRDCCTLPEIQHRQGAWTVFSSSRDAEATGSIDKKEETITRQGGRRTKQASQAFGHVLTF